MATTEQANAYFAYLSALYNERKVRQKYVTNTSLTVEQGKEIVEAVMATELARIACQEANDKAGVPCVADYPFNQVN